MNLFFIACPTGLPTTTHRNNGKSPSYNKSTFTTQNTRRPRAWMMCESQEKPALKFDKAKRPPPGSEKAAVLRTVATSSTVRATSGSKNIAQAPTDPAGSTLRRAKVPAAQETGEKVLQRRRKGPKKVTKAAAAQKSMSFADAWSVQNRGKFDIWFVIALLAIITPFAIIAWGIRSGVIPTGGVFD